MKKLARYVFFFSLAASIASAIYVSTKSKQSGGMNGKNIYQHRR